MGTITYTTLANLVAGNPENVADVVDCFNKITAQVNGSLDANNYGANSVTAAKIEVQQAWQTIALTGLTGNLSYFKDSLGIVHFRGDQLTATSPAGGSTLCTLPVGYRPGVLTYLGLLQTNAVGAFTVVTIDTAGAVKNVTVLGTNTWSFGMMHFRAEN